MDLPEKYAGQHVQCPECRAVLRIPDESEDLELLRWFCSCGQRLKARTKSSGRTVRCPKCGAETTVPKIEAADVRFVLDSPDGVVRIESSEPVSPAAESPSTTDVPPSEKESLELAADSDDDVYDLGVPKAHEEPPPPQTPEAVPVSPMQEALKPEPEFTSEFNDGEGIPPGNLSNYFNAASGKDAAVSGMTQVLNGHWLYIPYALLASCAANLLAMVQQSTQGHPGAQISAAALSFIATAFFWAAFIGCIKDGIFERSMGVERLLYHGLMNVLRFAGTLLLMLPIGAAIGFGGALGISAAWVILPGIGKILVIVAAALFAIFFFTLLLLPPVVCVLEKTNPLFAVGRGLAFGFRKVGALISLSIVSVIVGFGICLVIWFFFWLAQLFLSIALRNVPWLYQAIYMFVGGIGGGAIMGQLTASVMVLYLSDQSENRLQRIHDTLRSPQTRPQLLYATIVVGAIALLVLCFLRLRNYSAPFPSFWTRH